MRTRGSGVCFDHSGPDFKEGGIERGGETLGTQTGILSVLHLLALPLDSASVVAALGRGWTPSPDTQAHSYFQDLLNPGVSNGEARRQRGVCTYLWIKGRTSFQREL